MTVPSSGMNDTKYIGNQVNCLPNVDILFCQRMNHVSKRFAKTFKLSENSRVDLKGALW